MNKNTQFFLFLCTILLPDGIMGNETTPLPLGASDLASNTQLDPFKSIEDEIKTQTWKWDAPEWEFEFDSDSSVDSDFQLSQPSELEQLQVENTQLKVRVSELERRVAALEKHLHSQKLID